MAPPHVKDSKKSPRQVGLKLNQDDQMAENDDFRSKRPPKWSRWPPVDDIEYEKLIGMVNGNLS